jgi:hypothetical protein
VIKLGSLLHSVAVSDKRLWRPPTAVTQDQCATMRRDIVEVVNLFARLLDHSFHQMVVCNQFQQLNVGPLFPLAFGASLMIAAAVHRRTGILALTARVRGGPGTGELPHPLTTIRPCPLSGIDLFPMREPRRAPARHCRLEGHRPSTGSPGEEEGSGSFIHCPSGCRLEQCGAPLHIL